MWHIGPAATSLQTAWRLGCVMSQLRRSRGRAMIHTASLRKTMTNGELGLLVAFGALFALSILIAGKAYTTAYSFHAVLFAVGSLAAIFAITNRYQERAAALPLLTIGGKPNYNMGPVKFATV